MVYDKIKQRSFFKDHVPKKAKVPPTGVHVAIREAEINHLADAYAVVIYNFSVFLQRRGDEALTFRTSTTKYERYRKLGGFHRPRVSFNILSCKDDPDGSRRLESMSGTRECVWECYGCLKDHDSSNSRCPMSPFEIIWVKRCELYESCRKKTKLSATEFGL